jgi:predicted nucleotidyltransferase
MSTNANGVHLEKFTLTGSAPDTDGLHLPNFSGVVHTLPYPLLFLSVSGSRQYGFASPDSDVDLRGVHLLPTKLLLGLADCQKQQSYTRKGERISGYEIDLVTHDLRKFLQLMLGGNGNALETLYSPLVVVESKNACLLRELVRGCITRRAASHYREFGKQEWKQVEMEYLKDETIPIKHLLYCYRLLMTGIHLMRTGEVEANIVHLQERMSVPFIPYFTELMERKRAGDEPVPMSASRAAFEQFKSQYAVLQTTLEDAADASFLPDDKAGAEKKYNDFLLSQRGVGSKIITR